MISHFKQLCFKTTLFKMGNFIIFALVNHINEKILSNERPHLGIVAEEENMERIRGRY